MIFAAAKDFSYFFLRTTEDLDDLTFLGQGHLPCWWPHLPCAQKLCLSCFQECRLRASETLMIQKLSAFTSHRSLSLAGAGVQQEAKRGFCSGNLRKCEPCSLVYSPCLKFEDLKQPLGPTSCLTCWLCLSLCFSCLFRSRDQWLSVVMTDEQWLTWLQDLMCFWRNSLSLAKQCIAPSQTLQLTLGNIAMAFVVFPRSSL